MRPPEENKKMPNGEFAKIESDESLKRGGRYDYQKPRSARQQAKVERQRFLYLVVIGSIIGIGFIVVTLLR